MLEYDCIGNEGINKEVERETGNERQTVRESFLIYNQQTEINDKFWCHLDMILTNSNDLSIIRNFYNDVCIFFGFSEKTISENYKIISVVCNNKLP